MSKSSSKINQAFCSLFLDGKAEAFIPRSEGFSFSVRYTLIRLRLPNERKNNNKL